MTKSELKSLIRECIDELKAPIQEALEWKDIPEDEQQKALKMIEDHNAKVNNPMAKGYYAIDVTGKHQAYYTFWRWKEIDQRFAAFIKNPVYMGNLTTNLLTSVQKAIERVPNVKIELWRDNTRQHLIGKTSKVKTFTFGKYRGKSFPEVFFENPSYFAFLAKTADPKYDNTEMAQNIRYFADLYYEEKTKENRELYKDKKLEPELDSKGKQKRFVGELTIYNVGERKPSQFGDGYYIMYKLKDDQDHKFIVANLEKIIPGIKQGDKVKLSGRMETKEILGIPFHKLTHVKQA